jgi:hypothetical protein
MTLSHDSVEKKKPYAPAVPDSAAELCSYMYIQYGSNSYTTAKSITRLAW